MSDDKKPKWWAAGRQRRQFLQDQGLVGPPSVFQELVDWRAVVIGLLLLSLGGWYTWDRLQASSGAPNTSEAAPAPDR
jgi:hypothetical protein